MASNNHKNCPDCGATLHEIKLIDRVHPYMGQVEGLLYALPESKRSIWTGTFQVEGAVASFMCEQCGRIFLYGQNDS
jgi:hypothetical protein